MKRPRITGLDLLLLALLGAGALWLSGRLHMDIAYQWQWGRALQLVFTQGPGGEPAYFIRGLATTARIALLGALLALLLGTLGGLAIWSRRPLLALPAVLLVQTVRNLPPLVVIFLFYFFLANQLLPWLGITAWLADATPPAWLRALLGPVNRWENLLSGVICIGVISASFVAEIVRAGLDAVPKGQWEASQSLGLPRLVTLTRVILPQALRLMLPALTGQLIALVKETSVVSLISVQELTFVGNEMASSSGLLFEIWLLVAAVYLLICLSLFVLLSRLERRQGAH